MLGVNGRSEEGYAPFDEMEEMQMLITNYRIFLWLQASQASAIDGGTMESPEK